MSKHARRTGSLMVWAWLVPVPRASEAAAIPPLFEFTGPGAFDFSGAFEFGNDVALIRFDVPTVSDVTAFTTSYDSPSRGFDPYLALFDPTGALILGPGENDDRDFTTRDALITVALVPGVYTLALTQSPNFASFMLADGFDLDDDPFLTIFPSALECDPPGFIESPGDSADFCRENLFSGRLIIVDISDVPEPASVGLFAVGMSVVAIRRRRRSRF